MQNPPPFLRQALEEKEGIILDQRMREAFGRYRHFYQNDFDILTSLHGLNSSITRSLKINDHWLRWGQGLLQDHHQTISSYLHYLGSPPLPPEYRSHSRLVSADQAPIDRIIGKSIQTKPDGSRVITTGSFLKTLFHDCLETGNSVRRRPVTADAVIGFLHQPMEKQLRYVPEARAFFLDQLQRLRDDEDFQYIITLEQGRIVFRVVSTLDDYVQASRSGNLVPQRAILPHFKDQFGGFTDDEIEELEDLLNDPRAGEQQFQNFFEGHQHFLRRWDVREVYSQVHLRRDDAGDLIPDFILTDREAQKAAIVELKLPRALLIRRQDNRDRFSGAVQEARAQLLKYRRWFEEPQNRAMIREIVGMDIYAPHLAVIIGRSSEFQSALDRQILQSEENQVEIVTYDDILRFANQRRLTIREFA